MSIISCALMPYDTHMQFISSISISMIRWRPHSSWSSHHQYVPGTLTPYRRRAYLGPEQQPHFTKLRYCTTALLHMLSNIKLLAQLTSLSPSLVINQLEAHLLAKSSTRLLDPTADVRERPREHILLPTPFEPRARDFLSPHWRLALILREIFVDEATLA